MNPIKEATKLLRSASRGHSLREAFVAATELSFCALAKRTATTQARADMLEARYMQEVKRWPPEDVRGIFPQVMGLALSSQGVDFWGSLAGEMETLDARLGQFFTPYEVCRLMAEMTTGDVGAAIAKRGFFTVSEPAAGSGAMLLATADTIRRQGHDPETCMFVVATDLSDLAYRMCFLSLTGAGIPALVRHGNSLSGEVFDTSFTPAAGTFIARHGWPFNRPQKPIPRNRTRGQPTTPGGA